MAIKKKAAQSRVQQATSTWRHLGDLQRALLQKWMAGEVIDRAVTDDYGVIVPVSWKSADTIERNQAGAFSEILKRLLNDEGIVEAIANFDTPVSFTAQHSEFYIALAYRIRCELADIDGMKGPSYTKEAMATARKWGRTANSVNTYNSRKEIKQKVDHWIARIDGNLEYSGLTRKQMLKKELKNIEPDKPIHRKKQ